MPAFRNVGPSRHSGRLVKEVPVIWDMLSGWPVIDSVHPPVPHNPRDSPISHTTTSPSPFPASPLVPYPDRLQKQELNSPCIPSSPLLLPTPTTTAITATRKNSHSRRRDPGHIPRPRNAFIFFRSHYIASGSSPSAAGQQNELSKSAAKVWNQMTPTEKRPFAELAAKEKREHAAKYPNYTYAPGRTKAKAKALAGGGGGSSSHHRRKRSTTLSSVPDDWSNSATSPESFSGVREFSYPPPVSSPRVYNSRVPRAAAQRAVRRFAELPSPASSRGVAPTSDDGAMSVDGFVLQTTTGPGSHSEFVPTADIPPLELTPLETKPREPQFDISSVIPHVDIMPEQFGFKPNIPQEALNAWLPPLPRTSSEESSSPSPSPFFYPDGRFDVSLVHEQPPLAPQYPTHVPLMLSSGVVSGYDFGYQPPAEYAEYASSQSYTFHSNGTMLEGPMGYTGAEYDMGEYFDFDSQA